VTGDVTEAIADVLEDHRYTAFTGVCPCGFRFDVRDEHDAHIASVVVGVLTTNGWALTRRVDIDEVAEAMADADDGIIFGLLTPDEAEFYRRMAAAAVAAVSPTQTEPRCVQCRAALPSPVQASNAIQVCEYCGTDQPAQKARAGCCPGGCDCSCCYGYPDRDCHCFTFPCNCGGGPAEHGLSPTQKEQP
jgi:hypothetical protein